MLVLRRSLNQRIIMASPGNENDSGKRIVITILAVEGDRVKIGIDAPLDVTIVREELIVGGGYE